MDVPAAGLRPPGVRLRNKSNNLVRVVVAVDPDGEIEVPEASAVGVLADQAFQVVGEPAGVGVVEEAGGKSARTQSGRRQR